MKRRNIIHSATCIAALHAVGKTATSLDQNKTEFYDIYGGWKGKKFKATGFFRVEKDERWWIVTPQGHAFISYGINHYHDNWWNQKYNMEHFKNKFNAKKYQDKNWKKGYNQMARNDLQYFGFNTLGMHTNNMNLNNPPLGPIAPYIRVFEPIILSHYRKPKPSDYIDVFSPEYEEICDKQALRKVQPYANDPFLLGYNMADCPMLCDADAEIMGGTTWARELRNLGPNSQGKIQYVKLMSSLYPNINSFNLTYRTKFTNWDSLLKAKDWRTSKKPENKKEASDNHAFMKLCIDKYYGIALKSIRKVDKNHMFFGDKINADTTSLESIYEVTSKHTDIITYQSYKLWEDQETILEKISQNVDKPIMNGDGMFNCITALQPNPHGIKLKNRLERCENIIKFAEGAFSRPEFVGWHICGIIDTLKIMPGKEKQQHQGLYSTIREHFPDEKKVIQDISNRLYDIATTKV